MIEALVMAAVLNTGPDHLVREPVNMKKPHTGGYAEEIVDAATIPKKWRAFAACVCDRESGGTLDKVQSGVEARNPNSSASGRWQFLNSQWNESLPYMVAAELKEVGVPKAVAKEIRIDLQSRPIHKWHGYWQDIGFVSVVTEPGGWQHWSGGGACNGKRP